MITRHTFTAALAGLALIGSLTACDSFVTDVDPLVDRTPGDSLDTQRQVGFVATGVKQAFNDSFDQLSIAAELLSDAGVYDQRVRNSSFPTYRELDTARILLDNNTVRNAYSATSEYRGLADDIGRRATDTITFTDDEDGAEARRLALWTANFHGGVSRYLLGSYFGLNPGEGGGAPLSTERDSDGNFIPGPFVPAEQLYQQAIEKYTASLKFAANAYERRLVNTLIARTYLYLGDRAQAGTFAANGLVMGDAPYTANYNTTLPNDYFNASGPGRTQFVVNPRFARFATGVLAPGDTVQADPRTPVTSPALIASAPEGLVLFRQNLYTEQASPITFASWQENNLIRAEVALLGSNDAASGLTFVNAVRTAAGLDGRTSLDQAGLLDERDKALFTQGQRLIDQRRFNIFHETTTSDQGVVTLGPWRYLPIPQDERDANPNL